MIKLAADELDLFLDQPDYYFDAFCKKVNFKRIQNEKKTLFMP